VRGQVLEPARGRAQAVGDLLASVAAPASDDEVAPAWVMAAVMRSMPACWRSAAPAMSRAALAEVSPACCRSAMASVARSATATPSSTVRAPAVAASAAAAAEPAISARIASMRAVAVALGQRAHLVGDDREAAAVLARPRASIEALRARFERSASSRTRR
jgi:hypothetical protein